MPQMEAADCGSACISMLLGYHGLDPDPAHVRLVTGAARDGVDARSILHAARRLGLGAKALRLSSEAALTPREPYIAHWCFNHFVVVERASRRGVRILDPAVGPRDVDEAEFGRSFTGVAIRLSRPAGAIRTSRTSASVPWLELLRPAWPALVFAVLATIALEPLGVAFPAANRFLIDNVFRPRNGSWLPAVLCAVAVAIVARTTLLVLRDRVLRRAELAVDLQLVPAFVARLLSLPQPTLDRRSPGDLLQRVRANEELRRIAMELFSAMLNALLAIGYALLLISYEPTLSLVVIAGIAARLLATRRVRGGLESASATELRLRGEEIAAAAEPLAAPEVARSFGAAGMLHERFEARLTERINASADLQRITLAADQTGKALDGIAQAIVMVWGGSMVLANRMSLGAFAGFLTLQAVLKPPIDSIVAAVPQILASRGVFARLEDVLRAEPEPSGALAPEIQGRVRLDGVEFRHSSTAAPVLSEVSLDVAPGECLAIVGPSGSGKSTLLRLVAGLLRPTSGVVAIDGVDQTMLDANAFRRRLGVVFQELGMFAGTIGDDLVVGNDHASPQEVRDVLRALGLDRVVASLPEGLDTRLSLDGSGMSGGQLQRLSIARALLRRPRILLLDEATSALDPAAETDVMDVIARQHCTRLIVAHRLSSVRCADRVAVVERGRIVQLGSFEELSAAPGLFRQLLTAERARDVLRN